MTDEGGYSTIQGSSAVAPPPGNYSRVGGGVGYAPPPFLFRGNFSSASGLTPEQLSAQQEASIREGQKVQAAQAVNVTRPQGMLESQSAVNTTVAGQVAAAQQARPEARFTWQELQTYSRDTLAKMDAAGTTTLERRGVVSVPVPTQTPSKRIENSSNATEVSRNITEKVYDNFLRTVNAGSHLSPSQEAARGITPVKTDVVYSRTLPSADYFKKILVGEAYAEGRLVTANTSGLVFFSAPPTASTITGKPLSLGLPSNQVTQYSILPKSDQPWNQNLTYRPLSTYNYGSGAVIGQAQIPYGSPIASLITGKATEAAAQNFFYSVSQKDYAGAYAALYGVGISGAIAAPFVIGQKTVGVLEGLKASNAPAIAYVGVPAIVAGGLTAELASGLTASPASAALTVGGLVSPVAVGRVASVGLKGAGAIVAPRVAEFVSQRFPPAIMNVRAVAYYKGTTLTGEKTFVPIPTGTRLVGGKDWTSAFTPFDVRSQASVSGFGIPKGTTVRATGKATMIEDFVKGRYTEGNVLANFETVVETVVKGKPVSITQPFESVSQLFEGKREGAFNLYTRGIIGEKTGVESVTAGTSQGGFTRFYGEVKTKPRVSFIGESGTVGQVSILDLRKLGIKIQSPEFQEGKNLVGSFAARVLETNAGKILKKIVTLKEGNTLVGAQRDIVITGEKVVFGNVRRVSSNTFVAPKVNIELVPQVKPLVEVRKLNGKMKPFTPEQKIALYKAGGVEPPAELVRQVELAAKTESFKVVPTGKSYVNWLYLLPELEFFKSNTKFVESTTSKQSAAGASSVSAIEASALSLQKTLVSGKVRSLFGFKPPNIPGTTIVKPVEPIQIYKVDSRLMPQPIHVPGATIATHKTIDFIDTITRPIRDVIPKPISDVKYRLIDITGIIPRFKWGTIEIPLKDTIIIMDTEIKNPTPSVPEIPETPIVPAWPVLPPIFPPGGGTLPGGANFPRGGSVSGGFKAKKGKLKFEAQFPYIDISLFKGLKISQLPQNIQRAYYLRGIPIPTRQTAVAPILAPAPRVKSVGFKSGFRRGGFNELSRLVFGKKSKKKG